jgi:hypothetical protein
MTAQKNNQQKLSASQTKSLALPSCALSLLLYFGQPANAQSYSYLPWALGSSLLYPLRYLGYSAYGNSGYGNPAWYAGSILQRATRGVGGYGYNGYSPYGNPNFANANSNYYNRNGNNPANGGNPMNINNSNYDGGNGINKGNSNGSNNAQPNSYSNGGSYSGSSGNQPQARFTSTNSGYANDLNGSGNSGSSGSSVGSSVPYNLNSNSAQNYAPNYSPNYAPSFTPNNSPNNAQNYTQNYSPSDTAPSQNTASWNTEQVTPQNSNSGRNKQTGKRRKDEFFSKKVGGSRAKNQTVVNEPAISQSANVTSQNSAPFAMAFINNVNNEYDGKIGKALANPQTRAWAQSLGVTLQNGSHFQISDERSAIIERIFKDNSLDPVSKLDAIKILLRN